jgi:hypothetical protein
MNTILGNLAFGADGRWVRLANSSEQFLHAGWEPSNGKLAVMSGETIVGCLKRLHRRQWKTLAQS